MAWFFDICEKTTKTPSSRNPLLLDGILLGKFLKQFKQVS